MSIPLLFVRLVALLAVLLGACPLAAQTLDRDALEGYVMAPYRLGEPVGDQGVWTIETSDGAVAAYIFETAPLAPIPGFTGEPINLLVTLDTTGRFLDVTILSHKEPIFISGLGQAPFDAFVLQYRGLSVGDAITVRSVDRAARGAESTNVYLDGITKATASVRIANESILAAALQVARERMQGIAPRPAARPRLDHDEALDWTALVEQGIARRLRMTNADLQALFVGTLWEADDPEALAAPDDLYLDLWVIDVGPPSVARAVLSAATQARLAATLAAHEEPILLLADGRHQLVDADFVRNTEPDRIAAGQGGLPVLLRDADIDVGLAGGMPDFAQAMLLRADTRLGFDPGAPWTLIVRSVRQHGTFMPDMGVRDFDVPYAAPARFFTTPEAPRSVPAWQAAAIDRTPVMLAVTAGVLPLVWLLAWRLPGLARHRHFPRLRLVTLAATVGFVGWYAHGQLSIVTPLGVLRNAVEGGSFVFLLYEPLLLLLWAATLISLVVWGRGFFCGWLCPYGALQEFAHVIGRRLRLPEIRVPAALDRRLKWVKYAVLAVLVGATLVAPTAAELLVEVEPFKTAMTMAFDRPPVYVLYAVAWLVLGVFVFKGFCRYVCPLGAALALGGRLRRFDWIRRRTECGTPCQFCRARCAYGAIRRDGRIDYDECFQCLDCVTIIETPTLCVPDRLAAKRGRPVALAAE